MNTPKLPPLPEPYDKAAKQMTTDNLDWAKEFDLFTAEQMQAYAIAAIQAQGVPDETGTKYQKMHAKWRKGRQELANLTRAHQALKDQIASAPPAPQAKPKPLSDEQKDAVLADVVSMLSKQHDWLTRTSAINLVAGLYGRARFVLANVIKE